jgi:hypothetical protein
MLICWCCSELFNHGSPSRYLRVLQNEQDAWDGFSAAYGSKRCSNLKVTKTFGPNRSKKHLRTIIPSPKTLQKTR